MSTAPMHLAPRPSVHLISRRSLIAGTFLLAGAAAYALGSEPVALIGLLLIFGGAIGAPHQALALAVLVVPAYLHGRNLLGYQFSPHTIAIVLTSLAIVVCFAWRSFRRWRAAATDRAESHSHVAPHSGGDGTGHRTRQECLDVPAKQPSGRSWWRVVHLGQWSTALIPRPIDLAIMGIVLLGIASMAITIRPTETMRALREVILVPVLFYYLVVVVCSGRIPSLASDDPRDLKSTTRIDEPIREHVTPTFVFARVSRRVEWLAAALVAAGVASALIGLGQIVVGSNLIEAEGTMRIRALYGSPNNLGLLLGRAIPMAVALGLAGRYVRWPYLIALGPMLLALGLTYSVGAWLGVGVALIAVALLARRRALWLLIGAVGMAGLLAILFLRVERVVSHFSLTGSTTFFRIKIWESSLMMLRDFPITGIGLDAFLGYYDPALGGQYMRPEAWQESTISHPHNLILDVWLSLGLAGLIAAAVIAIAFARYTHRILDNRASAEELSWGMARPLAIGAVGVMIDMAVHGAIDNSYFLPDLAVLFWSTFAIVRVLALSPAAITGDYQTNLEAARSSARPSNAPIPLPISRPP